MNKKYSQGKKELLVRKFKSIKEINIILQIIKIILKYNPDVEITGNSSSTNILFGDLENITYYKIENFLKEFNKKNDNITDYDYLQSEHESKEEITKCEPRLRYSNKEKMLLKKKHYEDNLND